MAQIISSDYITASSEKSMWLNSVKMIIYLSRDHGIKRDKVYNWTDFIDVIQWDGKPFLPLSQYL